MGNGGLHPMDEEENDPGGDSESSPTNIVWKFPAGTPTTAPWKDFVSKSSPTNIRWKFPVGTPTTAPWFEFAKQGSPTNIKLNQDDDDDEANKNVNWRGENNRFVEFGEEGDDYYLPEVNVDEEEHTYAPTKAVAPPTASPVQGLFSVLEGIPEEEQATDVEVGVVLPSANEEG